MPTSVEEGKAWTLVQAQKIPHQTILDVGPGAGRYAELFKNLTAEIDAVEIWEPYVKQYGLESKYRQVFVQNFLDFGKDHDERYDIVVMGDVLEHFEEKDALLALFLARTFGRHVFISTPTVDYPQGPYEGNHYESHLSQFYWEDLIQFPGYVTGENFTQVGVVLLEGFAD